MSHNFVIFENWFKDLTITDQKILLEEIKVKYGNDRLFEGIFLGPSQDLRKGLFTGPSSGSTKKCPTCGKNM